jgi:transposase, IS30 family
MWPDDADKTVSHETIYNAIYLHPRGELKRELIACLHQHNQVRKPRGRGADRRGQIKDMQSIHIRPPAIEDRLIPGNWEGDLIKGEGNRSSTGTLVERTSWAAWRSTACSACKWRSTTSAPAMPRWPT